MEKKKYTRPAMQVHEMKIQGQLLQTSGDPGYRDLPGGPQQF